LASLTFYHFVKIDHKGSFSDTAEFSLGVGYRNLTRRLRFIGPYVIGHEFSQRAPPNGGGRRQQVAPQRAGENENDQNKQAKQSLEILPNGRPPAFDGRTCVGVEAVGAINGAKN
jgi:hypothetical protein